MRSGLGDEAQSGLQQATPALSRDRQFLCPLQVPPALHVFLGGQWAGGAAPSSAKRPPENEPQEITSQTSGLLEGHLSLVSPFLSSWL